MCFVVGLYTESWLLTPYIDGKNAFATSRPGQPRYLIDFQGPPSWEAEYGCAGVR